ncbi:hypothetical protein ACL02S_03740 [Nocardia sp. 004]|uniref:hypothetical protein n=1 Tax=Nocardia sp. 004 TaxID=3385978 RepID=UPI00399FB1D3
MPGTQQYPVTQALNTLINAMHPPTVRDGRTVEITHRALAEDIGRSTGVRLSANYLWKLRTGQTINPSLETLEALRAYFGLDSLDPLKDPELATARSKELALIHALKGRDDTATLALVLRDRLASGAVRPDAVAAIWEVLDRIEAEQRCDDHE